MHFMASPGPLRQHVSLLAPTEATGLWREVTGVMGDAAADACDRRDDLLGNPDFPESDFVNEALKHMCKHGIDLADNMP